MHDRLKTVGLLVLSLIVTLVPNGFTNIASKDRRSAFLIIDVQECFLPGGSLAVERGDAILPIINSIRKNNSFDVVVFSLDWHLPGHVSFASAHNKAPFDVLNLRYLENGTLCLGDTVTPARFPGAVNCTGSTTKVIEQVLYPDHCVENVTTGPTSSSISHALAHGKEDIFIHKGTMKQIDSYSAFFDNGKFFSTSLDSELKKRKINTVFVSGFALDICVYYTSIDAKYLGYETYTVIDASLGIVTTNVVRAKEKMAANGVKLISHNEIPAILKGTGSSNTACPALALMLVLLLTSVQFVTI